MGYLPEEGTGGGGGLDEAAVQALIDQSGAIRKLSTMVVQTNIGTKQDLYIVPAGKDCIALQFVARDPSADLSSLNDALSFGNDATAENFGTMTIAGLADNSIAGSLNFPSDSYPFIPVTQSGEVIGCAFFDTSITATLNIDVFGYLIDA